MNLKLKLCLYLAYSIFIVWLYSPVFQSYFSNDDWVILWYSSKISPSDFLSYFSMKTIWFYRPLQTLFYGLNWHLVGLDKWLYSLESLAMHMITGSLVGWFIAMLFGRGIAALTVLIFSVSSISPDVLLWAANFNTLQHAITTLGATCFFVKYLQAGRKRTLGYAIVFAIANCLTKEACINLPLVLSSVWLLIKLREINADEFQKKSSLKQALLKYAGPDYWKSLSPFILITIIYVMIHRVFFANIEPYYHIKYEFVNLTTGIYNLLYSVTYAIIGIVAFPVGFDFFSFSPNIADTITSYCLPLPLVLLIAGFRYRKFTIVFCVLFAVSTLFPTFALSKFKPLRYYYVPSIAGCLLVADLIWPQLLKLKFALFPPDFEQKTATELKARIAGYLGIFCFGIIWIINVLAFQTAIRDDVRQARFVKESIEYLATNAPLLPKDSQLIIHLDPNAYFISGMGVTEMIAVVTGRNDIVGSTNDQKLVSGGDAILGSVSSTYMLQVFSPNHGFVKIK